jgi:adenylate cyclase
MTQGRSEQGKRRLDALTLHFTDPVMERRYRESLRPFRHAVMQLLSLAGSALWIIFTLLNAITIHDGSEALLAVRLVAICGTVSSFIATLLLKPGRWVEPAGFAVFAFNIVCLTLVLATMSAVSIPYYSPLAISMTQGIVCFGLAMMSFVEGILLALITVCLFFITVTLLWPEPVLVILFNGTWLFTVISLVGIGAYCLDRTMRIAWLRQVDLTAAEERIRVLLHNILPPPIAARKLRGEAVIADNFSAASLLFADLVGFTELSSRMAPTDVVSLLNDLFARFDRIVARYGLEKIKTIGDCYMVASGIPNTDPDHLKKLMQAALEMLCEVAKVRAPGSARLSIRIGIHAGPVAAGVIGESKFAFDVWGDTVNVASRMESSGVAGQIQVTDAVATALADIYSFNGPEFIDIKGKGLTRVWRLDPVRDDGVSREVFNDSPEENASARRAP